MSYAANFPDLNFGGPGTFHDSPAIDFRGFTPPENEDDSEEGEDSEKEENLAKHMRIPQSPSLEPTSSPKTSKAKAKAKAKRARARAKEVEVKEAKAKVKAKTKAKAKGTPQSPVKDRSGPSSLRQSTNSGSRLRLTNKSGKQSKMEANLLTTWQSR